jgi:hypothetical protein
MGEKYEQWLTAQKLCGFNNDQFDADHCRSAWLAARDACLSVVEGGSFLHDQAPANLFAAEVAAAIRREVS